MCYVRPETGIYSGGSTALPRAVRSSVQLLTLCQVSGHSLCSTPLAETASRQLSLRLCTRLCRVSIALHARKTLRKNNTYKMEFKCFFAKISYNVSSFQFYLKILSCAFKKINFLIPYTRNSHTHAVYST